MGPAVLELDEVPAELEHEFWLAVAVVVLVWRLAEVLARPPLARYPPAVRMVFWRLGERSSKMHRQMLMRLFSKRRRFSLKFLT